MPNVPSVPVAPKFLDAVRQVARSRRGDIDRLKATASTPERRDLWMSLIRSLGTLGRSKGWEGLKQPERLARLAYAALVVLAPEQRESVAEEVFREAKVRLPARKAQWLAANVERVRRAGGVEEVQRTLESLKDPVAIVAYLGTFQGVGKKYARNIPMDGYHPAFRDTIAVDARIKSVSKALGLTFGSYEDEEDYYVAVARAAGLEPWELDRLLYNFKADVLDAMGSSEAD
jgi:hypothetical protein